MKVDPTTAVPHGPPQKQRFAEVLRQRPPTEGSRHLASPQAPPTRTPGPTQQVARSAQATPSVQPPKTVAMQPNLQAPKRVAVTSPVGSQPAAATLHAQAAAPTKQLTQARVHVDAEAKRLGGVRSEHAHAAQSMTQARTERGEQLDEKQHAKLADALAQEFAKDTPPPPLPAPKVEGAVPQSAPARVEAPPESKAAQAAALIEKIDHFVRSNRPGLSLTLHNSLGARVELERLGPKELSVKLFGKPGAEAVGRIREELRARGLNVKLTVV